MQNVGQSENRNIDKVNVQLDVVKSSTPQSSASSPAKSETETYSGAPAKYMTDSSESEDDSVSEAEMEEEGSGADSSNFLLSHDDPERAVDPEMQARLEALLEAAGIGKLSGEGKHLADPEVLRRLTSSVSCALDEAAAALTRMRSDQPQHQDKPTQCGSTATGTTTAAASSAGADMLPSLAEACSDGDVGTVKRLLTEGRSVHETTEEGESLLSLACSAGYYELAQVLLAMHASVEDRGIKGDCTPLMEAASAGHVDIVRLLVAHGADVNAVSGSGNTPLMYACAGGHEDAVRALLHHGANVEDHNENGHTPLMEAASAGYVAVAKILLEHGAGINTHSNEFKESALTLACYKGHLDMVRFLLAAGADREHKTDEMHTALMEASMDGHVEVARLLLDSGAQVNMPTDSFESPLTLAACGGHVDLAMLLLERGANIEEVNDEGYTPLMEAAREGHEEMVALLLGQGASINAQTDETQETALTLACCGGFLEVADFLIKAGADLELGASTPLMEASQEGHLELVRYLINGGADVHAQTQTGDTALTYACENGHTDVAELLLRAGAALEHESEGGRTPLMKACRAGHVCCVQYLVGRGADVNRTTVSADHTPLSLACAGGHADVVKFLLACDADPFRKLKDNSSTLIEAAKGGHTCVVQLLLDYPHSVMLPRAPDDGGLSAAQAAALGLQHACAPGGAARTLLPHRAASPTAHQILQHGRKKSVGAATPGPTPTPAPAPAPAPAPTPTPLPADALVPEGLSRAEMANYAAGFACGQAFVKKHLSTPPAAPTPAPAKHKCARKQRPPPTHADHHLPPPDQICEPEGKIAPPPGFTWNDVNKKRSKKYNIENVVNRPELMMQRNESPSETERNLLELPDASGPPTLATSALHALDLQFCAQGVTTVHPPTTPPYPPPQQMFPPQQLAANLNQQQQLQKYQQLVTQQQQTQQQQKKQQPFAPDLQQRPQAVQQQVCNETDDSALRLLDPPQISLPVFLNRDNIPQEQPQVAGNTVCQYRVSGSGSVTSLCCSTADTTHPTLPYSHYRSATFAPPISTPSQPQPAPSVQPQPPLQSQPQPQPPLQSQPQPQPPAQVQPQSQPQTQPQPHSKREQHHHASVAAKKKGRLSASRSGRGGGGGGAAPGSAAPAAPTPYSAMDVDAETDSNHDTALTLACAGGHEDLVDLLLERGANIEHKDKKGFTPLILAATAGHEKIVEILLNHGADIEAQSERTKDTPLSLACSGGRYEVVELILSRGANKEHRNVSDYTPLSLAASGGYVNIIRLLLHHQAEINSRTGSKLGISPLMLAAMNGHTAAVRLLLDCGSDINAQIETNRNTALTLACFQGRHEVVSLLLDRKANVEHRAKTGLTPLMEAASGGYVEVGRVLLDKAADVNAPPVPSSRDTALTIAADKGHTKFVELLLQRKAAVEVKNKKGNSPLWLAANGGHLAVVEMLYAAGADIDSQDNRKVSCLMAAFRKGHTKVVKWMVGVVTQFPSDQEMTRYICTISDKELLEKCQECVRVIRAAKETQAARANKNATILLEEIDAERSREESRRQAAARRRERKKKKKIEKKVEEKRKMQAEVDTGPFLQAAGGSAGADDATEGEGEGEDEPHAREEGDSGIDANSQGSCSSSDVKAPAPSAKTKKKKKEDKPPPAPPANVPKQPDKIIPKLDTKPEKDIPSKPDKKEKENVAPASPTATPVKPLPKQQEKKDKKPEEDIPKTITVQNVKYGNNPRKSQVFESTRLNLDKDDVDTTPDKTKKTYHSYQWEADPKSTSPKGGCVGGRREEGWKEVVRKSSVQTLSTVEPGCKKVSVASHAISRVIGRAGSNINAIRSATGAHIEVDKQGKGQGERVITIKGSAEATKQAASLIAAMIRDPEADISALLPRAKRVATPTAPPAMPKPAKQQAPPNKQPASAVVTPNVASRGVKQQHAALRVHPPRLQTHAAAAAAPAACARGVSYTSAMAGAARTHTFAAKLTATTPDAKPRHHAPAAMPTVGASPLKAAGSPPATRVEEEKPAPETTANTQLSPDNSSSNWTATEDNVTSTSTALHINTSQQSVGNGGSAGAGGGSDTPEYSLFRAASGAAAVWGAGGDSHHNVDMPQVDASKAPGYRGGGCGGGVSPSSRASSHGSTPPPQPPAPAFHAPMPLAPPPISRAAGSNVNAMDMSGLSRNGPIYPDNSRNGHNMMVSMSGGAALGLNNVGVEYVTRMPPRQHNPQLMHHKHNAQLFPGASSGGNLSTLLMSYQQPSPKPMPQPQHMQYQSLLERGGAVGAWGAAEEERKPRPIGTERAWKLTNNDDWPHAAIEHDRYAQSGLAGGVGAGPGGATGALGMEYGAAAGGGATAAALSLMHALPLQYLAPDQHWDQQHQHAPDKQTWSKWSH